MNVLVNTPAAAPRNVSEESDETWDRVMRVNLTAWLPHLQGGVAHLIQRWRLDRQRISLAAVSA